MAADEMDDIEEPILLEEGEEGPDSATVLTGALVFVTFGLLILAHFMAQQVLGDAFGKGLFA